MIPGRYILAYLIEYAFGDDLYILYKFSLNNSNL